MSLNRTISQIEQLSPEDFKSLEQYLEKRKGTSSVLFKVRDGWVTADQQVWWWSEEGPQACNAGDLDHARNMREYPDVYSIKEPSYRIVYEENQ